MMTAQSRNTSVLLFLLTACFVATLAIFLHNGVGIMYFFRTLFGADLTFSLFTQTILKIGFSFLFFLLFLSKNAYIRIFAYCWMFTTFVVFSTYEALNTSGDGFRSWLGFELGDAHTLLIESGRDGALSDLVTAFWQPIAITFLKSLFFVVLLAGVIERFAPRILSAPIALAPILTITSLYIAVPTSGAAVDYFPVVLKVPMQLLRAANLPVYRGERDDVTMVHDKTSITRHVVFVVDESIRGDMLSVNGFRHPTTPFLESIRDRIFNFGIATSATNSSAGSNIILQTGVKASQMNGVGTNIDLFKQPNIFQYAQAAGFFTTYLDGQSKGAVLQNYMRGSDLDAINDVIQIRNMYPRIERSDIDYRIADELLSIIRKKSEKGTFTYVLKSGAHFPYTSSFPASENVDFYQNQTELDNDLALLRNQYQNSLKWNVDGFFRYLVRELGETDVLILYTSDHGQSLQEDGFLVRHGTTQANVFQGLVPLFLLPNGDSTKSLRNLAQPAVERNKDRATHFNIFPTLLTLFGYDEVQIKEKYGSGIFGDIGKNRTFFIGFVPGLESTTSFEVPEFSTALSSDSD